jgi:hypothetical protein
VISCGCAPFVRRPVTRVALAMFHDMSFSEGDKTAGLEGNNGDMHIVAQIARVNDLRARRSYPLR